jgi:Flp pilus assembly pilin Flp
LLTLTEVRKVIMRIELTAMERLRRGEDGQDLLEYALLAALIAVVALGAVQSMGATVNNVLWSVIAAANV